MERNIGDQLNKAFEAYRQVSIEKDNAQKELQKMVSKCLFKWDGLHLCSINVMSMTEVFFIALDLSGINTPVKLPGFCNGNVFHLYRDIFCTVHLKRIYDS